MSVSAEFSVRAASVYEAGEVLARLRAARRCDAVADIQIAESRLNWIVEQLRPVQTIEIIGPIPSPGWLEKNFHARGTLSVTAQPLL